MTFKLSSLTAEYISYKPDGRYRCPECEGGSSREKSLNIWREGYYAMAKCHRASCGAFAKFPNAYGYHNPYGVSGYAPGASQEVLRPYTGELYPISQYPNVLKRFKDRYGFNGEGVYTCSYGDAPLFIPILSPSGQVRGHVEKRGLFPGEQKGNKIWKAKEEPMISWTTAYVGQEMKVTLVEDQVSALKYAQSTGMRAVALLGTNLTVAAVGEIQRHAEHVTIALDADATAQAFRIARRWGAAFKSCQVKILQKDIKDDVSYNQTVDTIHYAPGSVIPIDNSWLVHRVRGFGNF